MTDYRLAVVLSGKSKRRTGSRERAKLRWIRTVAGYTRILLKLSSIPLVSYIVRKRFIATSS